jgi:dimethylargininase
MLTALMRAASPALARCRLEYRQREPIAVEAAFRQQRDYAEALRAVGVRVVELPALPEYPDAAFVEDDAVPLDELAVLARMGAAERQPEVAPLAEVLADYLPLHQVDPPGTLEGGDVLRIGRRLLVGISSRTNAQGAAQLGAIAGKFGYSITAVPVTGCLHLKTAVTHIGGRTLLVNRNWVDVRALSGFELLAVPEEEPWAANTLTVSGWVLVAASAPRTRAMLAARGLPTVAVDIGEFEKAEAGLTCLSLLFESSD